MTKPNWWQLPTVDATQRTYADHMHSERLTYEAKIAQLERRIQHELDMRHSLERVNADLLHEIDVLWETAQVHEDVARFYKFYSQHGEKRAKSQEVEAIESLSGSERAAS